MNYVESILLDNIGNPASLFIFPTSTSASQWTDHLLRLRGGTLAMNKFVAWDDFKRNSIRSTVQNKNSIPSALRKIFTSRLVKENADLLEQGKTPYFTSLIREQYAAQAGHFAPWLAKILPQLGIWYKNAANMEISEILGEKSDASASRFTGDDRDMYNLARAYAEFLEKHNLFEPAWETPPFKDEGKECFIFFPESLNDFSEYRELLQSSPHVKIITLPGNDESNNIKKSETFFYTNSRREIKEAAMYIRALHEKENTAWSSIAVCIGDPKNYEPYVIREFRNKNIPFVKRTGKPLTDYSAGRLFCSILDCTSQDFSFSSLVELVLNKNFPWLGTEHINNIVDFGIKNNCLYSWTELDQASKNSGTGHHINVWEEAFKNPLGRIDPESRKFFEDLKKSLQALRASASFSELRNRYFAFRNRFMDMQQCPEETDLILSRCISELMELIKIEKDFKDAPAVDPFSFFTEYLSDVSYLAQSRTGGVSILPYNTAASAPFDCHIILGASQENLSIVNTRLDFLTRKKREALGIFDEDASENFINLHKYNSVKCSAFFSSEQTFSGFTIPHSKIGAPIKPQEKYITEDNNPEEIHENDYLGFLEWKDRLTACSSNEKGKNKFDNPNLIKGIINDYTGKRPDNRSEKPAVSATALQSYFSCSLIWLFERVLKLENFQIEASLMAENIAGSIYHEILNNFFTEIKKSGNKLLGPEKTNFAYIFPPAYDNLLIKCIDSVFDEFSVKTSSLTKKLLHAGKHSFKQNLKNSLVNFLAFFAGCSVFDSEKFYNLEKENCVLTGKADCILKDETNPAKSGYIVVDFKMKNMPAAKEINGLGGNDLSNFQLPMYITLTEENENIKIYKALFYSILNADANVLLGTIVNSITGKTFPYKKNSRIEYNDDNYKKLFDEFKNKVTQFSNDISAGAFTVFESDRSNCYKCGYHRVCRTTYIINRGNIYEFK